MSKSFANFFRSLESGQIQINNREVKKHTLNLSIKKILDDFSNHDDIFCIDRIVDIISLGAMPHNSQNENNTLSITLRWGIRYIEKYKKITNILDLIDLLISIGAVPSNSQDKNNSLSLAVRTKCIRLIKKMMSLGSLPDNSSHEGCGNTINVNTLTHCVETQNIQLIDSLYHYGALPDNSNSDQNTLLRAIRQGNPLIVKKIILFGGGPISEHSSNEYPSWSLLDFILNGLIQKDQWKKINIDDVFKIIYYVLCINKNISRYPICYCMPTKSRNNDIFRELLCYGLLLNDSRGCCLSESGIEIQKVHRAPTKYERMLSGYGGAWYGALYNYQHYDVLCENLPNEVNKLKKQLNAHSNELVSLTFNRNELNESLDPYLPSCCSNIVIEYAQQDVRFDVINWD